MSERGAITLPRILIGLAIGAAAVAFYNRRAALLSVSGMARGDRAELALSDRGGASVQDQSGQSRVATTTDAYVIHPTGTTAGTTAGTTTTALEPKQTPITALQKRVGGIREGIQHYIDSARAQLDVAIAEGQATAAQTRQELEQRFVEAKRDPQRARTAFD